MFAASSNMHKLCFCPVDNSPGDPSWLLLRVRKQRLAGLQNKTWELHHLLSRQYILRVDGPSNNHASAENNSLQKKFVLQMFLLKICKRSHTLTEKQRSSTLNWLIETNNLHPLTRWRWPPPWCFWSTWIAGTSCRYRPVSHGKFLIFGKWIDFPWWIPKVAGLLWGLCWP